MSISGSWPNVFLIDEQKEDPMNVKNSQVPRTLIKEKVLCAVFRNGTVLHIEERQDFRAGPYAVQAHQKFGRCRVLFFRPSEDLVWREIRWKNANAGTLYKRPSFKNVAYDEVPAELKVAMMCVA